MEHIKQVKLQPGETMTSFDVKALLTSVPVDPSIQIVQQNLTQDTPLPQRTSMSITQIKLLEFYLKHTYFLFQGRYYEWVNDAAMGSPISPLLPTCSWKSWKSKPLTLPPIPPFVVKVCG